MTNNFEDLIIALVPHLMTSLMVVVPAVIGGIIHMVVVSKDWFSILKIPVSKNLFGENKTLRGFVVMPLGAVAGAFLAHGFLSNVTMTIILNDTDVIIFGLAIGFFYVLFELPNSFLKRKLGIKPGETSGKFKYLFIILDQIDSSMGIALAAYYLFNAPFVSIVTMFIMGLFFAFTVKPLLYILKLKKTAV